MTATAPRHPFAQTSPIDASTENSAGRARFRWLGESLIIAVYVVLAWQRRAPSLTTMNDDAFYIFLARSLRHFQYVESFIVGSPIHVQYPPGYPAFLAIISGLLGERVSLFVALNVVLMAAALALFAATVRSQFDRKTGLLVLAACALNPTLVELGGLVRSESLFVLLWALTLWAVERSGRSTAWTVATILAAVATTLTRTAGLPLIAGVLVHWAIQRRWRAAVALALVATVAVGGWFAWIFHAPQSSLPGASYIADVKAAPQAAGGAFGRAISIVQNAARYFTSDIPFTLPMPSVRGTAIDNVLVLGLLSVTVLAGFATVWRRWRVALLAGALYMGLLIVWPFDAPRFLVPLLPLLFATALLGAEVIARRFNVRPALGSTPVLAIVLITAAVLVGRDVRTARACDRNAALASTTCFSPDQVAFAAALRYAGGAAPAATPIVAAKEATASMLSGHPVVRVTSLARLQPHDALAYLRQVGATYAVVGYLEGRDYRLVTVLEPECRQLRLERTFEPKTFVFRITGDTGDDGTACTVLKQRLADWGSGGAIGLW